MIKDVNNSKKYAYFFTRQDISPEQQIVQTAHAALLMGAQNSEDGHVKCHVPEFFPECYQQESISPQHTYFTVCGVRNLEALKAVRDILDTFGYQYDTFFEPDMDDEMTSVAVYPVDEDHRGPLLAFDLLKVGGRG